MMSEREQLSQRGMLGVVSPNCWYDTAAAAARHTGFLIFFFQAVYFPQLKPLSPFDNASSTSSFLLSSTFFSPGAALSFRSVRRSYPYTAVGVRGGKGAGRGEESFILCTFGAFYSHQRHLAHPT